MGVEALSDLRQEIVFWVRMLHTLLIILYVCVEHDPPASFIYLNMYHSN
jgi:hypothetical protein